MKHYNRFRFITLLLAFLLILIIPFLHRYFDFQFIQGWYQSLGIGKLWFVSPLEGLESILVSRQIYVPVLIGMLPAVLIALFLGRVFCAWICPISFLSELIDRVICRKKKKRELLRLPRQVFWFALLGELVLTMIIGAPLFVFLSPPGLVGREMMLAVMFHTLALEGVVIVVVLLLHLLSNRFFCRYLCPLGALLAFIGARRRLKVELQAGEEQKCLHCGLCARSCPLGLDPEKGETASMYCWNCGACIDACPQDVLKFRFSEQ